MRRVIRGGGAVLVAVSTLLMASGCSVTPQEEGDAQATTSSTASETGAEPAVPPGGLSESSPGDAEPTGPTTATTPGDQPAHPTPHAGADVRITSTALGDVLVDADGFVLYGYTGDRDGLPTCDAACTKVWPAAVVEDDLAVAPPLDEDLFELVDGATGRQLKVGRWPLYRFTGDTPGDTNGHGLDAMFYAVAADGTLIRTS